jgi:hypothetical protein
VSAVITEDKAQTSQIFSGIEDLFQDINLQLPAERKYHIHPALQEKLRGHIRNLLQTIVEKTDALSDPDLRNNYRSVIIEAAKGGLEVIKNLDLIHQSQDSALSPSELETFSRTLLRFADEKIPTAHINEKWRTLISHRELLEYIDRARLFNIAEKSVTLEHVNFILEVSKKAWPDRVAGALQNIFRSGRDFNECRAFVLEVLRESDHRTAVGNIKLAAAGFARDASAASTDSFIAKVKADE